MLCLIYDGTHVFKSYFATHFLCSPTENEIWYAFCMDEGLPTSNAEKLKPKLELQPYSEAEVWVTLEFERMFDSSEDVYAFLRQIAERISLSFTDQIKQRRMFVVPAGKQIRISTGGTRDFKPEEIEQIRVAVQTINSQA